MINWNWKKYQSGERVKNRETTCLEKEKNKGKENIVFVVELVAKKISLHYFPQTAYLFLTSIRSMCKDNQGPG